MHIWVDADACPAVIKDILYRAAERTKLQMTLVANKALRTPPSPYIRALQVPRGIDVADSHIVRELSPGDLVITADIPLASDVIAKGAHALNPRGEFYSPENIQERMARCDVVELSDRRLHGEAQPGRALPRAVDGWPHVPHRPGARRPDHHAQHALDARRGRHLDARRHADRRRARRHGDPGGGRLD